MSVKKLQKVTDGLRMRTYWIRGSVLPFGHSLPWAGRMSTQQTFKRYYPTSTLVTGYDIIPFWVSRMIFQGLGIYWQVAIQKCLDSWSHS